MKKLIYFIALFILVALTMLSCSNKEARVKGEQAKEMPVIRVGIYSDDALDNNLLRPLDGKTNIQNSMEALTYDWHMHAYGATSYSKKFYEKFFADQNPGMLSPEQKIIAYEVRGAKTVSEVFYALPTDHEWKWLTQSQMVDFVSSNRGFIRDHDENIVFFCKKDENKALYERNLASEMIAVVIDQYKALKILEITYALYGPCIVIAPQKN